MIRAILGIQILAASLFIAELFNEIFALNAFDLTWEIHELIELGTVTSLIIGSAASLFLLSSAMRRNAVVEDQLKVASGEFSSVLEEKFTEWELTNAEKEVALLSLKGFSVAEVAEMREKSLGTIKSQNAALYKKASVSGRAQLMASLMEDLLDHAIADQNGVQTTLQARDEPLMKATE